MPTAYCVRSAAINDQQVSEAIFEVTKPGGVTFGADYGVVGKNTDKVPLGLGWNIQYDTTPVPLDAVVSKAKIVLTADFSASSVFGSLILRFGDDTSPNLDSVTETIHQQFKWLARARDTASTELALASSTGTFDTNISVSQNGNDSAGQVLTLATAGNGLLGSVSMWMRRIGVGSYPGTCVAKVYATSGTSGFFKKGSLLATSSDRNTTDITTAGTGAEFVFTLPSPLSVSSGQIMIVEVSFTPAPTGGDVIFVTGDTGFSNPADNSLLFGPSMQAFSTSVYMNGSEQAFGNGDFATSEPFVFPTFVAGNQYEIGDTLYSPDVTLTNFTQWVQDGLDGRGSSNRLSFSILPPLFGADPPTIGEERRWRSADHATPQTVDGFSFFGTVLVVEYTLRGPVLAFPPRARAAVAHGEILARPAVSSPAVPRARAAVRTAEDARARPAIQRGEARARPTVRRP